MEQNNTVCLVVSYTRINATKPYDKRIFKQQEEAVAYAKTQRKAYVEYVWTNKDGSYGSCPLANRYFENGEEITDEALKRVFA